MMFIGTNSYILQLLKCLNIIFLLKGGGVAPVCLSTYLSDGWVNLPADCQRDTNTFKYTP